MGKMINIPLTIWPLFFLVLFFTGFILLLLWTWRRSANESYRKASMMPLEVLPGDCSNQDLVSTGDGQ
jgi:cbb3-type cytochrome oxidase subunit 3